MAQYLFAVHHDITAPKMSKEREEQSYRDTSAFNEKLQNLGALVFANGISDPSEAKVVDNTGDQPQVSNTTFITGSKYLGGFWVVEAPDAATAQEWALEASKACNQPVEVRPFHG